MRNELGVIISLAITLLLLIPQIHKRDFNFMDVVSHLYFSTATATTFVFNLNIFVERSGFLGYFTLFLMALISLVIKQPFTFQVSKRDYPEICWREKSFLVINNVITGVWAAIFIANDFRCNSFKHFNTLFPNTNIISIQKLRIFWFFVTPF